MTLRRDLSIFAASALAAGWIGVGVNRLLGQENSMESPGSLVWLITPVASSLVLRRISKGRFLPKRSRGVDRRSRALAWGAALSVYPVVTLGTLALGRALGLVDTSTIDLSGVGTAMAAALVPSLVKNIAEEAAWRGYLTEELMNDKAGRWTITAVVGLIWGCWHAPYYLFFLPEEQMRQVLDVDRPVFAAVAVAVMVGWTVLFTEVYALPRSIWPSTVMHALEDSVVNPPVMDGGVKFTTGGQWLVSPVVGAITTAAYAGAGVLIRRLGRRRSRTT